MLKVSLAHQRIHPRVPFPLFTKEFYATQSRQLLWASFRQRLDRLDYLSFGVPVHYDQLLKLRLCGICRIQHPQDCLLVNQHGGREAERLNAGRDMALHGFRYHVHAGKRDQGDIKGDEPLKVAKAIP